MSGVAGEEHDKSIRSRKPGCPRMARRSAKTEVPLQSRPRFRFAPIRAIRGQNTDFISPARDRCYVRQTDLPRRVLQNHRHLFCGLQRHGLRVSGICSANVDNVAFLRTPNKTCVSGHGGFVSGSKKIFRHQARQHQSNPMIWVAGEARVKHYEMSFFKTFSEKRWLARLDGARRLRLLICPRRTCRVSFVHHA